MRWLAAMALCTAFGLSCSSDSNDATGDISGADSAALSDSAQLFVLPAPLQVATFLQMNAQEMHPEFLADKSIPATDFATDYQRALNLGMCISDVGYSALYGNRQLALDYMERAEQLVVALKIEAVAMPYMIRIRGNIDQRDSLSYLLLTLYNEAQAHLNEAKREKTAFYLVSGSYIENLAITVQHEKLQKNRSFVQLLSQEKLWLDNLTEALTYLEPDEESQDLYNTFYTLQDRFKDIVIGIDNNLLSCTFTPEAFARLRTKSVELRDEVLGKR